MKNIIKYLIFIVIGLIIIIEIFLRINYHEQLKTRYWSPIFKPDSLFVFNYVPNIEATIISPGLNHKVKINHEGFFGPEFEVHKPDSVFRIVVVGNSNCTPLHMNSENSISVQLQKIFRISNCKNVEVINCALNGSFKDLQLMNLIKYKVINYNPDLILFQKNGDPFVTRREVFESYQDYMLTYVPNDLKSRNKAIEKIDKIKKAWYLTMFYDGSYIVRGICKKYIDTHSKSFLDRTTSRFESYLLTYIRRESYQPTVNCYYTYKKTSEVFNDIVQTLKPLNCKFVLFTENKYPTSFKEFLKRNNLNYIESHMELYRREFEINSKLEGHYNKLGHALWAEQVFNQLILNNYIPVKFLKQ